MSEGNGKFTSASLGEVQRLLSKPVGPREGTDTHKTSADRVYAELKAMVLAYRLPPMRAIQVEELAAQLRVSRTPVREALHRLRGEGLVSSTPNAGFFAPEVSERGIRDLYRHRLIVECGVAYQAARQCSFDSAAALQAWWQQSSAEALLTEVHARATHNESFYGMLAGLTANPFVAETMNRLNERLRFFRRLLLQKTSEFQVCCDVQELMLQALTRNRAAECLRIAKRHVERRIAQAPDLARQAVATIYLHPGMDNGMLP